MLAAECLALGRARALWWVMARREITARYAGTAAGVLWAYIQPLLMVAAYYLVFDVVFAMRLGDNAPTTAVGAYLVVGSLPWMAFCDAVGRGTSSLLEAGTLLHKNALPPILFPARTVLASAVVYGPLLLLMALVYAPAHQFAPAVLAVLPLLALQVVLVFLLAYVLAILAAALRDVVQLVGFALSLGIYVTPILFPLSMVPPGVRWLLWVNPVTPVVLACQSLLLQGQVPPWQVWPALLAWIVLLLVVLAVLVRRSRDQWVDWL